MFLKSFKKLKLILIIILAGVVVFQSTLIFFLVSENEPANPTQEVSNSSEKIAYIEEIINNPNKTEFENMQAIEKAQKPVESLFISGWIPDWDMPNWLNSVRNQNFDSISPVFFYANPDGTLKSTTYTNHSETIAYAKENNIELLPTITLFDTDLLSSILETEEKIELHISEIMNQVISNDYDGIDIDYESIYLKDKEAFFFFLEELSLELAKSDKKFSFTVLPKWGDQVFYNSLPQTRMVQDYKRIADLTDEFRIMSYEYTARDAEKYGPIAPLAWMEDIIRYTIYSGVPREKIVLGIHTYSYDYTRRPEVERLDYYPTFFPGGTDKKPSALANFPVAVQAQEFDSVEFNEEWGEAVGSYTKDEIKRFVVFPNQRSIDLRKELAAEYGLKGVAYWRVGSEGTLRF